MVLKRIGVLSAAKIAGVLYGTVGLLVGLGIAAVVSLFPLASANSDMPSWLAPMFGVGAIVLGPIVYGVLGSIGGAVGAVIYNIFAGMVGGLELQLETSTRP